MNREHDAGREYAEIWGETVQANRKLRTLATILAAACLTLGVLLLRVATVEPPRPIVVRVDEVGRAEAVAYEAATAQADPLDPTTKYLNRRIIQQPATTLAVSRSPIRCGSLRVYKTNGRPRKGSVTPDGRLGGLHRGRRWLRGAVWAAAYGWLANGKCRRTTGCW